MASVAQMKNRMHSGHRDMLQRIQAGQWAIPKGCSAGSYRGYRKIWQTLVSWNAVDGSGERALITSVGKQLLEAKMNTMIRKLEIDAATKALSEDRCAPVFQACYQGRVVGPALGSWPKCKVKFSERTRRETWLACWTVRTSEQQQPCD